MEDSMLSRWDASEYLDNPELIAEYLNAAMEENDQDVLLTALANIARAKGMSELAAATGLGRASLYKTLTPGAKPRFETVNKIINGLGIHLHASSV
ncbi:MAG: putative addiction module antidote protein [Mariprofundales bacterium]|nr:putative addiction module antidote protein [Mariprofundales bacterium]